VVLLEVSDGVKAFKYRDLRHGEIYQSTNMIRMGTGSVLLFFDAMTDFWKLLNYVIGYHTGEAREDLLLKLSIGNARGPHLESTSDKLHSQ
jgi:hypothetical protein